MCMAWPCHSFVDGLYITLYYKNKIKIIKVILIIHDCLPIIMLLYIMLAYSMLFAALSNAVCLHNAFLAIDFCKCFVLVY